jgi:DNA modification methylase
LRASASSAAKTSAGRPSLLWTLCRFYCHGQERTSGHVWAVQTREQTAVPFPDTDALVVVDHKPEWQRLHPCPKPLEEMEWLVRHLSRPGDIILDPFAGTGSTLLACKLLGRHYIGAEISRLYAGAAWRALSDRQ